MSEKKVVVPEGMLKAAGAESNGVDPSGFYLIGPLEAALRWWTDNGPPIMKRFDFIPHDGEEGMKECPDGEYLLYSEVKRMFLTPEPKVDYADRILENASVGYTPTHAELDKIWENIFCAGHGWTPPPFRNSNQSVAEVDARIPDLLFNSPTHVTIQTAEDRIRRAYRRGHKDGSK